MSDDRLCFDLHLAAGSFRLAAEADLPLEGVTALFGASGAGKTTLLRCLAGLEAGVRGRIECGGETWLNSDTRTFCPPHRRPVGLVFQDARLFPHLTVRDNLLYAADRAPGRGPDRRELVDWFGLASLLDRLPDSLSGGERQRVALARALAGEPRLLLLDEPVSAIGRAQRRDTLDALASWARARRLPLIYVGHAEEDMVQIADRVLPIAAGRLRPVEPVEGALAGPGEADGRAPQAVLFARIDSHDRHYGLTRLSVDGGGTLLLPGLQRLEETSDVRLLVRAADVSLALVPPDGISIRNILPARVAEIRPDLRSAYADIALDLGSARLWSRLTRAAVDDMQLAPGQRVHALIKSASLDPCV